MPPYLDVKNCQIPPLSRGDQGWISTPYQGGIQGGSAPPLSRGDSGGIITPYQGGIKGGFRGGSAYLSTK
ncbi:hypothetical protein C789_4086 [Microcystis aeruginosa FACHB-905 = DIANCHI905]|uniref:Uncharacterized protein n=1 Tax=Microcystis aeruginosa PCC 7806SL TaxID=1903187 RepID=A0AB33C0I8_MICA7|nr:hypothetical protein BH695_3816 [Microcystis aeruginosa PCC 7806SL]ELS46141.1 hypothetical protein C789_4086 [Microcystis aeruginosa FACHB-905 = DIANCHI905]